jgi:hypothetical protein
LTTAIERFPADTGRIEAEQEVHHDGVGPDYDGSDVPVVYFNPGAEFSDQPIDRFHGRLLQQVGTIRLQSPKSTSEDIFAVGALSVILRRCPQAGSGLHIQQAGNKGSGANVYGDLGQGFTRNEGEVYL